MGGKSIQEMLQRVCEKSVYHSLQWNIEIKLFSSSTLARVIFHSKGGGAPNVDKR